MTLQVDDLKTTYPKLVSIVAQGMCLRLLGSAVLEV